MDRMPTFESAPAPSLEIEPVEDMPREDNKKVSIGLEKETPFLPPKKEQAKAKKPMTEKQSAHMERMRQRKMELQAARTGKKFEKKEPTPNPPKENKTNIEEEKIVEPPKKKATPKKKEKAGGSGDDFEKWLDNYEMLKKMEHAIAKEEQAKRDAELRKKEDEARKEMEMEERIRKKILAEQKQKNMKVAPHRWTPQVKTPIPSTQNHLQTPTTDYGIYSNRYF
tara:strand:+ start:231 stop:902 length:672 start_codon:yes stop_codon:yes gene_type:complete